MEFGEADSRPSKIVSVECLEELLHFTDPAEPRQVPQGAQVSSDRALHQVVAMIKNALVQSRFNKLLEGQAAPLEICMM